MFFIYFSFYCIITIFIYIIAFLDSGRYLFYPTQLLLQQFVEAYDLAKDPDQLTNVAKTLDGSVVESLEESLATLAVCSGLDCHDVHGLNGRSQARPRKFDLSYRSKPRSYKSIFVTGD